MQVPNTPRYWEVYSRELKATIQAVIDANPQAVEDYHNGKKKAIGALVGQTMKATKGKANPAVVNKLLMELL